ncbi:MAG: metallophosphoesterase [Prolixibacteraceae bacterium]|nr:metallophosphoesterase [Prolixibacteraceae bacterium]
MHNLLKIILFFFFILKVQTVIGQFSHQLKGEKFPWTRIPNISGDNYRFVIISDLTGGEKEGVFEKVVDKINQLAPDFVMCVGDLIDGYTLDSAVMEKQWKSFHDRIAKLNAPFFYMPGNHDIANKMLFDNWISQYGYDYYSFKIGKSMFLILNAYESEQGKLSERQVQYVKHVLQAHDPKDPVYLFSHPPLWDLTDKNGLKEVWPILNKYNTTFFCGDDHHYIKKEVNGHTHYMLSNTGGGFDKENINLGVFNHILWLTSNSQGLTFANILTDGIIPADIVNNQTEKQVNILLQDNWFEIHQSYVNESSSDMFKSNLVIKNTGDFPLQVTGGFLKRKNITFSPDSIIEVIPAGKTLSIPIQLINSGKYSVAGLPEISLELNGSFMQNRQIIANSVKKNWIIDNLKNCYNANGETEAIICQRPGFIEESWSWGGPEDGSFELTSSFDAENIYVRIKTSDDKLIVDSLNRKNSQDKLFIHFTSDTTFSNRDFLKYEIAGGGKIGKNGQITGVCSIEGNGLFANLTISRKMLKGNFFRMNIGFRDQDDNTSSDQSVIWWKPVWGSANDYTGSGVFLINPN